MATIEYDRHLVMKCKITKSNYVNTYILINKQRITRADDNYGYTSVLCAVRGARNRD